MPVGRVTAAIEVDDREPEASVRIVASDAEHPLVDAELARALFDALLDLLGQGNEDQRAEQHHLQDAGPELEIPTTHGRGRLPRVERLQLLDGDVEAGHRLGDRVHEHALQFREAALRGDRSRDAADDLVDLLPGRG